MIHRFGGPSWVFAWLLLLASCGWVDGGSPTNGVESDPGGATEGERLMVVATTNILGDLVTSIVGEDARVVVLLPVGADPHDYRASAAQVALLHGADLVVANGLLLEQGLVDVFATAEADGINLIEVAEFLDPLPFSGGHEEHEEDDEGEDHGNQDPHFWMDPLRVAKAARLIAQELAALDPSIGWMDRADGLRIPTGRDGRGDPGHTRLDC